MYAVHIAVGLGVWDTAGAYPRVGRAQDLDLADFKLVALELLALLGRDPRPAQADGGTNSKTRGRGSPERGGQSVRSVAETRGGGGGAAGGGLPHSFDRDLGTMAWRCFTHDPSPMFRNWSDFSFLEDRM